MAQAAHRANWRLKLANARRKVSASMSHQEEENEEEDYVLPEDPALRGWLMSLRKTFFDWYLLDSLTTKKRVAVKIVLLVMNTICLIRTILLISTAYIPAGILYYCGDQMLNLEVTMRSMVIFVCLSFGSIILVFEVIVLVAETKKEVSFVTDAFEVDLAMQRLKFSQKEGKEMRHWIRMTRVTSDVLYYVAMFTMPSMIGLSCFIELSRATSVVRIVLVLFWAPLTIFWIIRESKIYLILMIAVVLDLKLIQLRLKSLNRRFTIDGKLTVSEYTKEFLEVRDIIEDYNKYVRWILMMIDYVSAPGNVANLYSAIASNSILILKLLNVSYGIWLMIATLFMIALPGQISAEVLLVYPRLMSMQVHNHRLSIRDKKKIVMLVESITSHEGEIGFTNGHLETFRNSTVLHYVLSLPAASMLFFGFVNN